MKVFSFVRSGISLKPVEVEVGLVKGVPQLQILGLPDAGIRESTTRIRSAIRSLGYDWPKSRQIVVQLRPSYGRKSSQGLDLAIAAAILWETKQMARPAQELPILYGELGLTGEVKVPDDLEDLIEFTPKDPIYTGTEKVDLSCPIFALKTLRDLEKPEWIQNLPGEINFERPDEPVSHVGPKLAKLIQVVAAGEHHALFAGPSGSGKTTMVRVIASILRDPDSDLFRASRRISKHFGFKLKWRPIVQPHHSATPLAVTGGGSPPSPGEMTRAHGGCLILDEYLEFSPLVQEALREPIETGRITLARGQDVAEFPAEFLLLATTNLCRCGRYIPEQDHSCKCEGFRRRQYAQRLSGPALDRFHILQFSQGWTKEIPSISISELRQRVFEASQFALQDRGQKVPNSRVEIDLLKPTLEKNRGAFDGNQSSRRRALAAARVARTLADLDRSSEVRSKHWLQALDWTITSFQKIDLDF